MKTRVMIFTVGIAILVILGAVYSRYRNREMQTSPEIISQITHQPDAVIEVTDTEATAAGLIGSRRAPSKSKEPVEAAATLGAPREIVNLQADIWSRQKAARALSFNLSKADQQILIKFLKERQGEDDGQGGHVLKNDVMDALVAQESVLPELAEVFTTIYRDINQHEVIRDYAVQHLSLLSERLDEPTGWDDDTLGFQRKRIESILWEVTGTPDVSMAGTALLGLTRLSEKEAGTVLDRQRLGEVALKIAGDPQTQEASRITAYQVCARLQMKDALPVLRQIAVRSENVTLQISAIGALGLMGGKAEVSIVEQLIAGGNGRLEKAAVVALRRIQERENRL